jgi:Protein of unknown function (DUF3455)
MNVNFGHLTRKTKRVRSLFVTSLVLGFAFGTVTRAGAQESTQQSTPNAITPPTTPNTITPPAGNSAFFEGHAVGTQGYVCLPTSPGASTASWTVNAARPEATLYVSFFDRYVEVITHFLSPDTNPNNFAPNPLPFGSPTWQSSFDSSRVWGQPLYSITAGSDPSCPNTGAVACLLLRSIGTEDGPAGGNFLSRTTYIQRLNTQGGSAPATGCSVPSDVGKQTLVPYTGDYYFYRANQ